MQTRLEGTRDLLFHSNPYGNSFLFSHLTCLTGDLGHLSNEEAVKKPIFWHYVIECVNFLISIDAPADSVGINFGEWETAISKTKNSCNSCHCHGHIYLSKKSAGILIQKFQPPSRFATAISRLICTSLILFHTLPKADPYEDYDQRDLADAAARFTFLTSLATSDTLVEIKREIGGMQTQISDIKTQMETQIGEIKTQIGGMETQMGDIKTQIGGMETQIGHGDPNG